MKIESASHIVRAQRERLDLEGAKILYDEAWSEFLLWPDEAGRDRVLQFRYLLADSEWFDDVHGAALRQARCGLRKGNRRCRGS